MVRTKLTLAVLVAAGAVSGLAAHGALAAHDTWYAYATSLTAAQQPAPFITDTLAPGGGAAASPLQGDTFITDTLAPGGGSAEQPATVSGGRGFGWMDAGIGALATAGLLLIVLGGTVLVRQRVHPAV
jgi:hypothetical protein